MVASFFMILQNSSLAVGKTTRSGIEVEVLDSCYRHKKSTRMNATPKMHYHFAAAWWRWRCSERVVCIQYLDNIWDDPCVCYKWKWHDRVIAYSLKALRIRELFATCCSLQHTFFPQELQSKSAKHGSSESSERCCSALLQSGGWSRRSRWMRKSPKLQTQRKPSTNFSAHDRTQNLIPGYLGGLGSSLTKI
jgi:hypothetical protein